MKTLSLNLDPHFKPTSLGEIDCFKMRFSGGESHIKLSEKIDYLNVERVVITNRFIDGNSIIEVLIAKDALQYKGIKNFDLVMPYVPYARQDRKCAEGESFTMKVFANLINSANFDNVWVLDAHSDVAPALLNNCINLNNSSYVISAFDMIGESEVILISPDSGANKKCNKLFEETKVFNNLVKCDKVRNVHTGAITGFEVFTNDLDGKPCLIVDDICDGGRTFIGIAKELQKKNSGDLYLFVTHGIFSAGFDELGEVFKKIFTTNSFKLKDSASTNYLVHQFDIKIKY